MLGTRPISEVATAIMTMAATSTGLRPTLSPKCPARTPPIGRAMKPTATVANELRAATTWLSVAKNVALKTSAAAVA